jgi:hypothetical protein
MDSLSGRESGKGKTPSGKKKKVDREAFEEQLRDIIGSSELSELDQFELPEEIRSRLEKADLAQLESIERELMVNEVPLTGSQPSEVIEERPLEEEKPSTGLISDDLDLEAFNSSYDLDQTEPEPSSVKFGKPVDGRCEVKVSEDKMSAFIDLYPSQHGGRPLTSGYVLGRLKSAGVVYGVNEELIKKLVRDVEQSKDIKRGVIIARGRLPEPGMDGSINYHFSSDDSVLKGG